MIYASGISLPVEKLQNYARYVLWVTGVVIVAGVAVIVQPSVFSIAGTNAFSGNINSCGPSG